MKEENNTRLKVNKNLNKKAVILKLTAVYLSIFVVVLFIELGILVAFFSFKVLIVLGTILAGIYLLLQYLDETNFLERFQKSKVPDEIYNDLF